MKYLELLEYAEWYSGEYNLHLGAVLTQADKAYSRWRSRHKHPRNWKRSLREVWWTEEALGKCTEKANWVGYNKEEDSEC